MFPFQRTCVFCGKPPQAKNREHVLPGWLIRLTGSPKRIVTLGIDWQTRAPRRFAFDQFQFPACKDCNDQFSAAEARIQQIVVRIEAESRIAVPAMKELLDWFDKVRVGLWLGFRYLNKNPFDITPAFHILDRLAAKDRMIAVYKAHDREVGLGFVGVDTPAFQLAPSAFALRVNGHIFFNMSSDFLFSDRLGITRVRSWLMDGDSPASAPSRFVGDVEVGTGRIRSPLLPDFNLLPPGLEVYQPILPPPLRATETASLEHLGDVWLDLGAGQGKLFAQRPSWVTRLDDPSEDLRVDAQQIATPGSDLWESVAIQTLQAQVTLMKRSEPALEGLHPAHRDHEKELWLAARAFNTALIERIVEERHALVTVSPDELRRLL